MTRRPQERWYSPDRVEDGDWLEDDPLASTTAQTVQRRLSPRRRQTSPPSSPMMGQHAQHIPPTQHTTHPQHTQRDANFQTLSGYLSGPNIEGSPVEMSITDAQVFALKNPAVKAFMYKGHGHTGPVWIYFKDSVRFTSSPGWTTVKVLQNEGRGPQVGQRGGGGGGGGGVPSPRKQPQTAAAYRDRIVRFYQQYMPSKYGVFFEFGGVFFNLVSVVVSGLLCRIFCTHRAMEQCSAKEVPLHTQAFQIQHNTIHTHRLPTAVITLQEYQGMEESLFSSLVRLYGPEPPVVPLNEGIPEGWKCVENNLVWDCPHTDIKFFSFPTPKTTNRGTSSTYTPPLVGSSGSVPLKETFHQHRSTRMGHPPRHCHSTSTHTILTASRADEPPHLLHPMGCPRRDTPCAPQHPLTGHHTADAPGCPSHHNSSPAGTETARFSLARQKRTHCRPYRNTSG